MCVNQLTRLLVFSSILLILLVVSPSFSRAQAQSPFLGSVPTGQSTGTPLNLSLREAIEQALKYNLGGVESNQSTRAAHAARLRSLNALLPNLTARISYSVEQINLRAQGFNFSFPGVNIPTIVGPFGVEDARAYLSQEIFNWSDIQAWKSASESEKASQYTYRERPRPGGAYHWQRLSSRDFGSGHC